MCSKYCPWISLFSSFHCTLNIIILFVSVTRQSFETTVMLLFIKHQVSYLLLFVSKHESELFPVSEENCRVALKLSFCECVYSVVFRGVNTLLGWILTIGQWYGTRLWRVQLLSGRNFCCPAGCVQSLCREAPLGVRGRLQICQPQCH